jgi:uncharacterized membrane protein YfcA
MVAMPLLVELIGIETAAPLVSLMTVTGMVIILIRERHQMAFKAVFPLVISSAIGIPLGVLALRQMDAELVTGVLGLVIAGYALYALFAPEIPPLSHPLWAYGFGLLSGLLAGAYNTGGPPLIVYANTQGWESSEFRGNLQTMAMTGILLVVITHALSGNLTAVVWTRYLVALPALGIGLLIGFKLDSIVNPALFRKVVLILLLIIGLRLLIL